MRNFIRRYFVHLFNGNEQHEQIEISPPQIASLNAESRDAAVGFLDVQGPLTTTTHISITSGGISGLPVSDLSRVDYEQVSIGTYCQRKYSQGANTCLADDPGNDDEVVLGVDALVAEAEARTGCCAACGEDADGNGVNTQGQGTNVVCTICMCAVSNPVRLPCNHVFCTRPCLQSWVHRSDYCPNCRALIIIKPDKGKQSCFQSAATLQFTQQDISSSTDALDTSFMTIYPTDEQQASDSQLNSSFIILENSNTSTSAAAVSGQRSRHTSGSGRRHSSTLFTLVSQFGREKYERLKLSLHLLLLWSLFALFLFLFFLIYQHHLKHGKLHNNNQTDSIANQENPRADNFHSYLASFPSIV